VRHHAATLAAAALLSLACVPAARAAVPADFFGVYAHTPRFEESGTLEQEHAAMAEAGVGSLRMVFDWRTAQPYRRVEDVPEAERSRYREESGVPTNWYEIDRQVGAAASHGMKLLPVVMMAPDWAAGRAWTAPTSPVAYARFVRTLARRYGPAGDFWRENPGLPAVPVREWQLWNEPDFRDYWHHQPFQRRYVKFVRRARAAVRQVDRRARIVLAGFANRSWDALARVYRAGGRRHFDVVAVHPFTATPAGVIEIVRRNRAVMRRYGDARKPVMVTELSWTSARPGERGIATSEERQASNLARAYRLLARNRRRMRIERAYWFEWLSTDNGGLIWDWAGLNRLRRDNTVERKPAYWSFREVVRSLRGAR
jgi:hypothetical protein